MTATLSPHEIEIRIHHARKERRDPSTSEARRVLLRAKERTLETLAAIDEALSRLEAPRGFSPRRD
jgi:hypothetical protein